jgi:heterodisulfide reductase subunit C
MNNNSVDKKQIKDLLNRKKSKMKRYLSHCAHCSICSESCFLYMANDKDPKYMPSYKAINSLGKLYKKRGNVDRTFLESIKGIVWNNCVMCRRCYCPMGVDIHGMIAYAREICRSQGVYPTDKYPQKDEPAESWL